MLSKAKSRKKYESLKNKSTGVRDLVINEGPGRHCRLHHEHHLKKKNERKQSEDLDGYLEQC